MASIIRKISARGGRAGGAAASADSRQPQFRQDVPLRSRFGNIATRGIMHALLGQKLTDTQTGLRGIPAACCPSCCASKPPVTSSNWRC